MSLSSFSDQLCQDNIHYSSEQPFFNSLVMIGIGADIYHLGG